MTSTSTGLAAEAAAADYLRKLGWKILEQNWRTRVCEIDIVAQHKKVICFVEVKYRASDAQGSGLDYITQTKLKQMRFAAELWVQKHDWDGDYQLGAIEVSGSELAITQFVSEL